MQLRSTISSTLGITTGIILLYASITKLLHWSTFTADFPLRHVLPVEITFIAASLLAAVELVLGIEAIHPANTIAHARLTLTLFTLFFIVSCVRFVPSLDQFLFPTGCSCFPMGPDVLTSHDRVVHLSRNAIFCLIAFGYWFNARPLKQSL